MSGRFEILNDAFVILRSKGVYRQAKVYERKGLLYAQHGNGFIGISASGGTSLPNVRVEDYDLGFEPAKGAFGYLSLPPELTKKAVGWKAAAE